MSRRRLKALLWAAPLLLVLGAWFVELRPVGLGGDASYVMIRGTSMLPAYDPGDLVITKRASSYGEGDIVAYRVPDGDVGSGVVVIHRITGGSATQGYVLEGDNNAFRDDWYPKPADIVGKEWLRIPRLGGVLGFLHAPVPLASLAAAIAVVFVLFPSQKKNRSAAAETAAGESALPSFDRATQPLGRLSALTGRPASPVSVLAVVPCVVHSRSKATGHAARSAPDPAIVDAA